MGGLGRVGARRRGRAGEGRAGRDSDKFVRGQDNRPSYSLKHRTNLL